MTPKTRWLVIAMAVTLLGGVAVLLLWNGQGPSSGSGLLSQGSPSAQETTLDTLGYPAHFVVRYLPLARESGGAYARFETWYYPDIRKSVSFLGGDIAYVEVLDPNAIPTHPTPLRPEDFAYEQGEEDIKNALGAGAEEVEVIPGLVEEEQVRTYVSVAGVAVVESSTMLYAATFDPGASSTSPVWSARGKGASIASIVMPETAYARGFLRDGLRCLGRVCKFVIEAPDRVTSKLGPVIGPIVSAILTKNLSQHAEIGRIFRDAQRIDKVVKSVEEQQRLVGELKRVYADQAAELRRQAEDLNKQKDVLGERLVHGVITFDEYKAAAMDVHVMLRSLEAGAEKLTRAGERVNTGTVLGLLGRDVLRQLANQAGNVVLAEVHTEVRRLLNIDVISNILAQGEKGGDAVLDLLVNPELRGALAGGDSGVNLDDLKRRIRDELKRMIQENKRDLRAHWQERIRALIDKTKQEIQAQNPKPEEPDLAGTVCEGAPVEGGQCPTGFDFRPMSGVGCVQTDCPTIDGAHYSYEGYCVCGSSGSIVENVNDANKECHLPAGCGSCPGCVYACVHFDEPCPEIPREG